MFSAFLDRLEHLGSIAQGLLAVLPVVTGLIGWLHFRLRHQYRYLRLIRRLRHLSKYLRARRIAFSHIDVPAQLRFEALEGRLYKELRLALHPDNLCWRSICYPMDADFLKVANRQLESEAFVSFADDLLRWLIISLDDLLEIWRYRQEMASGLHGETRASQEKTLELKHWTWREDMVRLERQIRQIKQFLAGQLEADICPETQVRLVRQVLIAEGEAYAKAQLDDRELSIY